MTGVSLVSRLLRTVNKVSAPPATDLHQNSLSSVCLCLFVYVGMCEAAEHYVFCTNPVCCANDRPNWINIKAVCVCAFVCKLSQYSNRPKLQINHTANVKIDTKRTQTSPPLWNPPLLRRFFFCLFFSKPAAF